MIGLKERINEIPRKLLYSHIAFEELFDVNNPIHDKKT